MNKSLFQRQRLRSKDLKILIFNKLLLHQYFFLQGAFSNLKKGRKPITQKVSLQLHVKNSSRVTQTGENKQHLTDTSRQVTSTEHTVRTPWEIPHFVICHFIIQTLMKWTFFFFSIFESTKRLPRITTRKKKKKKLNSLSSNIHILHLKEGTENLLLFHCLADHLMLRFSFCGMLPRKEPC